MPYYCTVPRCTSMAGKAKNVSFHQFPRDEELAKLWNDILKRGKPYTKYSKVCSLHFKPEDYTITSAGKNKGQWRTLRKDAIPSQNLPSDTPAPYTRRQSGAWVPNNVPAVDPQMENQARNLAQAIYMQTMLAMQAAGLRDPAAINTLCNGLPQTPPEDLPPHSSTTTEQVDTTSQDLPTNHNLSQDLRTNHNLSQDLRTNHNLSQDLRTNHNLSQDLRTNHNSSPDTQNKTSFQCEECSKCFKDPDVFVLHQRSHTDTGKENFDLNTLKPEMLKSNPILANLLRTTMERNIFTKSLFEKQLMVSFSNMENYLRNVNNYDEECDNSDLSESLDDNLVIDENVA